MSWVICQLAERAGSRHVTRAVNTDLVKYADDKGTVTVLQMVDGEAFTIVGRLQQDWMPAVWDAPPTIRETGERLGQ